MLIIATTLLRLRGLYLLFLIAAVFSTNIFAFSTHTLTKGAWSLISIPADPGSAGTVNALFGDDLPDTNYGNSGTWIIYSFDASTNVYRELSLNDTLKPNAGYWMVQVEQDAVVLDIPNSLSPLSTQPSPACPDSKQCASQRIFGKEVGAQWNLLGVSIDAPLIYGDTRFQLADDICATACTPEQAVASNLIGTPLYRYSANGYESLFPSSALQPWDGIWMSVLSDAQSLQWIFPLNDSSGLGTAYSAAEYDASRLLMQASFGPTDETIDNVLELGGPAAWINAQMALPAQLHLPVVIELRDDELGVQASRYEAFWRRTLHADDQLRQRVAFALSQILVISDRGTGLESHSDLVAAYYDVLLNNAFGNYRQLLQEVTLSPAMGLYLSMLGNKKPDSETGLRADENYAREVMQLFTIGLVGLEIDGTELGEVVSYSQPDVENLARALTGWFWNVESWSDDPFQGWNPDRTTLTEPMVAFAEHHDTDAKTILGTSLPKNLTAEDDLNMALDILFDHDNVGPFISKQLIKRLVTSNPSSDYVTRVATVFNDNGAGVKGDLSAVIRAILLDEDARSLPISMQADFGKLREPLLRYAHVMRAFNVEEPIAFKKFVVNEIPLIAPLTAFSVFNYYSPRFAPLGEIASADLVAPEFQINSGANLITVNRTLMTIAHDGNLKLQPTTLNIEKELQLLASPTALVDHLDRLLTAGKLSTISKQKLMRYIKTNSQIPEDDLVRDVISLIVTSTEYAVQR